MAEDPEYSMAPLTLAINTDPFVSMFMITFTNIYTEDIYPTPPQL